MTSKESTSTLRSLENLMSRRILSILKALMMLRILPTVFCSVKKKSKMKARSAMQTMKKSNLFQL